MSSTRTLVTLLRPWIRRFTIIISAWWLRTSSKFTWEEVKTSTGKLGKWSTPKRVRIRPKYSAPSLSRDRRIKMHQSINHSIISPYVGGTTQRLQKRIKQHVSKAIRQRNTPTQEQRIQRSRPTRTQPNRKCKAKSKTQFEPKSDSAIG